MPESGTSVQYATAPEDLRECAHRLEHVDPAAPLEDLAFLRARLGDARVVAMGEATHGTREFFLLKHRLIRYLVERMGFNIVALESSLPDTEALGAYVAGQDIDPRLALAGQRFWTWNTAEVLDLVRWMRNHNASASPDAQVHFVGYDMQSPATSAMRLVELVEGEYPGQGAVWARRLEPLLTDFNAESFSNRSEREQAGVLAHIDALERIAARGGENHIAVLRQAASMFSALPDTRKMSDIRDRAMAANVERWLGRYGSESKVAVWAHNMHIQKQASPFMGSTTLGAELAGRFGPRHVSIGFAFDRGGFQGLAPSYELVDHHVESLGPQTMDGALAELGHDLLMVDFREATDDVRGWLSESPGTRCIGSGYSDASAQRVVVRQDPSKSFDLLAFVAGTTPARRNVERPAPPTPPAEPLEAPKNLYFTGDSAEELPHWSVDLGRDEGAFRLDVKRDTPGQTVLSLQRLTSPWPWGTATVWQRVNRPLPAGRAILSAEVRAEALRPNSGAQLFLRADHALLAGNVLMHMLPAGAFSTTPVCRDPRWTKVELSLDVPEGTEFLTYGFVASGDGTAELKSLAVNIPI